MKLAHSFPRRLGRYLESFNPSHPSNQRKPTKPFSQGFLYNRQKGKTSCSCEICSNQPAYVISSTRSTLRRNGFKTPTPNQSTKTQKRIEERAQEGKEQSKYRQKKHKKVMKLEVRTVPRRVWCGLLGWFSTLIRIPIPIFSLGQFMETIWVRIRILTLVHKIFLVAGKFH